MAPTATGGSSDVLVGSVVTTLADEGLRVRSKPRINEDSIKLQPLLPLGAQLLVLQGPVTASGYEWYEVAPMTSRGETGWVARADRDGTPWIEDDEFDCPAPPRDIASLAALPPGVGLACFPRQPITVKARLLSCNCDMDGSSYSPTWFFLGSGSPELLVEPGQRDVPRDTESWFHLNLDPEGEHPAVLPVDRLVEVTGIFDHPAAAGCTETEMDGQPVASMGCRLRFAVTRLTAAAP